MPVPQKRVRRPARLTANVTSFFLASLAALGALGGLTPTSAAQDRPPVSAETVTGGQVDQSQSVVQRSPAVEEAVHHDVSPPLYLIPPAPRQAGQRVHPVKPIPRRISPISIGVADPVVQESAPTILAPAPLLDFDGVGQGFTGPAGTFTVNSAPPDTEGDVGPNHYVQIVNTDFAIFNKSGTAIFGPVPINTLWSGFGGGCQNNNDGDPIAIYDPIADRWVISQFSVTTTPFLQCVAVSQTADPTGAYNRYSFQYANFPDYPKMGVWPDAYYITFNMFSGNTFLGAQVCAYDRASMLAGAAATQQCFMTSTSFGGLLPADVDGARLPPAGSPNYALAIGTSGTTGTTLAFWKFHVDWTTPANTTFTGPTMITTAAYTLACNGGGTCIPQTGTSQQLDSLADRLMFRLAYRNFGDHESLVTNHSVTVGSRVGVRWYEIRSPGTAPTVFQQGTYAPDTSYRWMGSIAMDQSGNMGLGFSVSSSSIHPEIHYTGRLAADPPGQMAQGEGTFINGAGSQTGSSLSRWGDYSMMAVDPTDDCTFWYTNEYIPSNGAFNWKTRIGTFKFPGCGPPVANDFSISANPNSLSLVQGASGTTTISTAVISGSAETVNLSVSGAPSGATASLNPTSVTAGGSSTLTVNTGTAAAGTYTLTVTGTAASATHMTTVTLTVSAQNDFSISANPTSLSLLQGASGTSTISTAITLGSAQTVNLTVSGAPSGATASLNPTSVTAGGSSTLTVNTGTAAAGTYTLTVTGTGPFATHSTSVTLTVTSMIINGGFETGDLTGWTSTGSTSVSTTAHSGNFSAQVGSTNPGTDSSISQTFTVPASATQLSFWYQVHCPDTVTYDWATATLTDNTAATTTTVLPMTCSNTGIWVQATAPVTPGHSYTLTLANHDDNYPTDPTYTLYDDVILTSAPNDFSISANPTSLNLVQGASGTSTISTAVTSGSAETVNLTVSGAPSGATASLNPTSVLAGGSSTLTVNAGTATPGTYTLTITGTAASATHTASVTLTVSPPNDFSISANPTSLSIAQGASGTSSISTAVTSGSAETVNLTVSGAPSGATASLNPTSVLAGGSSTLTVSAGTATPGTYTLTVMGTAASATHSATVTVTIPPNDFSISANPTSVTIQQGASGTSMISTAVTSGSAQTVNLAVSGAPSGATASLNPTSVTAGGSSTLTVNAGTAAAGTYTLTVTGTEGSRTHSASVTLTVTSQPPPNDFSISANPTSVSIQQGASGTSTISTAVTSGSAQTVSLTVSGAPSGATASLNPTSVTAGGSSTLTVNAGTAAVGTYTLTVTGTGPFAVHSTSVTLTVTSMIINGGFETGDLTGWTSTGITAVVAGGHSGNFSAQVGSTSPSTDSSISQTFTAPSGSGTLAFWYQVHCPDTVTYDWATATLTDNTAATTTTVLPMTCTNTGTWVQVTAPVTSGHSYTLTLANHDDSYPADPTYTLYDDVTLGPPPPPPPPSPIVNGGFESGLTGWTSTGSTSVSTTSHSGNFSAQVGSTSPGTDSSLSQTFTVPVSGGTLSFWYQVHCPDTVTYDWASVTIRDNVTGTTATVLGRTCTNAGTWVQRTFNLGSYAGHSVTLHLNNHDDNYPGDPTYTLYDDVVIQ